MCSASPPTKTRALPFSTGSTSMAAGWSIRRRDIPCGSRGMSAGKAKRSSASGWNRAVSAPKCALLPRPACSASRATSLPQRWRKNWTSRLNGSAPSTSICIMRIATRRARRRPKWQRVLARWWKPERSASWVRRTTTRLASPRSMPQPTRADIGASPCCRTSTISSAATSSARISRSFAPSRESLTSRGSAWPPAFSPASIARGMTCRSTIADRASRGSSIAA